MAKNRELEIILKMRDEMSQRLGGIERELTGFGKTATKTGTQVDSLTMSMKKAAAAFGIAFGAREVFRFFKSTIDAAAEAERVQAQLRATLESTGYAAGVTAGKAIELSKALQQQTTYGDEAILSAENLLLTFTNIKDNILPDATKIVLDMSTALGQDLKSSAIQVGKALQDPILGATALRRVGVNLNAQQQELIKTLVETGRGAEAQALIMKELNTEFGGSAQAELGTYAGRIKALREQFNDLKEVIGKALMPVFDNFFKGLSAGLTGVADDTDELATALGYTLPSGLYRLGSALKVIFGTGDYSKGLLGLFGDDGIFAQIKRADEDVQAGLADQLAEVLRAQKEQRESLFDELGTEANFGGPLDDSKEKLKEMIEVVTNLNKKYKDFADDVDESLFQLEQSHRESMENIRSQISETKLKLSDLKTAYQEQTKAARQALSSSQGSNAKTLAAAVVQNEERIAEIQLEITKGVNKKKRAELEEELAQRQKAAQDNAGVIKSIESEVNEAKRLAGLTDLERAIEEFNERQALARREYEEKVQLAKQEYDVNRQKLEQELIDLKKKRKEEDALYQQKVDFIKKTALDAAAITAAALADEVKMTKEAVQKQIDMYTELARAIAYARAGKASEVQRAAVKVSKVQDAIITPRGEIIQTAPEDYIIATKNPGAMVGAGQSQIHLYIDGREVSRVLLDHAAQELKREMRLS